MSSAFESKVIPISAAPSFGLRRTENRQETARQQAPLLLDSTQDVVAIKRARREFSIFSAFGEFAKGAIWDTLRSIVTVPGLVTLGLGATVVAATGGAALPYLLGLGLGIGALQGAASVVDFAECYTEADYRGAEKAFRGLGSATAAIGGAWLGFRNIFAAEPLVSAIKAPVEGLRGIGQQIGNITHLLRGKIALPEGVSAVDSLSFIDMMKGLSTSTMGALGYWRNS